MDDIVSDLKRDEGEVSSAYYDSEGFLTIGCGRLIDKKLGGGLSQDEIDYLLRNDVTRTTQWMQKRLPFFQKLSANRQRALLNMGFNLGEARFMKFVHFIDAMRLGDWNTAVAELANSKWAQQVDDGIGKKIGRADRIAQLILKG